MLIKDLLPGLGNDVLMVSLDGDPNENADLLKRYAESLGFTWRFAVATREVMASLSQAQGIEFLDPTTEPMFAVTTKGEVHRLKFGHKSETDLRDAVQRART